MADSVFFLQDTNTNKKENQNGYIKNDFIFYEITYYCKNTFKMRNVCKVVFLFCLLIVGCSVYSQGNNRQLKNRQKQLEKQDEAKKKAGEEALEKGRKRHMKIQTKETRKRMKETKKKSKQLKQNKKPFFLWRWFGKK